MKLLRSAASSTARRRGGEPPGVEAGRPGGEVPPELKEARGWASVADGEAEVAQRAFMRVEPEDLGGGGGALKREALAQRPGGGGVAAQERVEQSEPGPGKELRIAPLPLVRAQAVGWEWTPPSAQAQTSRLSALDLNLSDRDVDVPRLVAVSGANVSSVYRHHDRGRALMSRHEFRRRHDLEVDGDRCVRFRIVA
jgi:hypothetical protein